METVHAGIAIVLAIVLIIRFKVDPVISLVLACVYLGLAAGLGAEGTIAQITGGFGEIISLEHYGASADYKTLYREFGITADATVEAAQRSLAAVKG